MNAPASITVTPGFVADLSVEGERMPVYVHVIDHPDARVLVDTGMTELHPAMADMDPRLQPLSEQDFDLAGVDIVVNTHLHADHCGGNHLFAGKPIYVQRRELDGARSEDGYTIREWVEAPGVQYVPVDGETAVLADRLGYDLLGVQDHPYHRVHAERELHDRDQTLAAQQASLRRVATLVAQGVPPSELFDAVAREVATLFRTPLAGMLRYEAGGMVSALAARDAGGEHADVSAHSPLAGDSLATRISRTGKPAREDAWDEHTGPIAAFLRDQLGIRSTVGSPVMVEGRVWGALFVHSRTEPLPADTESRLMNFTELVATAISNMQARTEGQELADEQAALRRVATLVARQSPPHEVFATVAAEVGRLLPVEDTAMLRYEDDETATVVASWGTRRGALEVGSRMTMGGHNVATLVHRTGQPARIDNYSPASGPIGVQVRELGTLSAIGSPIVVEGASGVS